jgi:hypothetical protein
MLVHYSLESAGSELGLTATCGRRLIAAGLKSTENYRRPADRYLRMAAGVPEVDVQPSDDGRHP